MKILDDNSIERIYFYIGRDGIDAAKIECSRLCKIYRLASLARKQKGARRLVVNGKVEIQRPGKRNDFYRKYVYAARDFRLLARNFDSIFSKGVT